MNVGSIQLGLSDQHAWRASDGISAWQPQDAMLGGSLGYRPSGEASQTESLRFGPITPSPTKGDGHGNLWRECNRLRGDHDG